MSISSISSQPAAALSALHSAKPTGRDSDGDNDNDATESVAAKAAEAAKGPLTANVGRSVDITA